MRYPPRPAYIPRLWDKRPAAVPPRSYVGHYGRPPGSPNTGRIYQAIVAYASEHGGNTPTFKELCQICDISSTSTVAHHVRALIERGKLELVDRKLIVVGGKWTPPED